MRASFRRSALVLGAALGAMALFATPAIAQKASSDEIVITPPVYSTGIYREGLNERAEVIVSTRDLDLRSDGDVGVLHARIRDGAHLACDTLDSALRDGVVNEADCRRDARQNAMRDARYMVASVRGW